MATFFHIQEAAGFIDARLGISRKAKPRTAVILGSGLSQLADEIALSSESSSVGFDDIPHFRTSTVLGHNGQLIYGTIDKKIPILAVSGRLHLYEGHRPCDIAMPIRALGLLGISSVILTNASGAIADGFEPGDVMAITDHLNLTGSSPLIGKNIDELGPRFLDMSQPYDAELIAMAREAAKEIGMTMHTGVYAGVLGPCYETPAEIRMLKLLGAHAVGMSTIFETIAARHMGLRVLAIACLTNKAAGQTEKRITHDEVLDINARAGIGLAEILRKVVSRLG